jgi:dTMP kinase
MFVVFEGIDGSGKTTVSNRVAQKLRDAGLTVEHLREGGKFSSQVTQAIREFGRDARNLDLTPHAEFFLYVTRDVQLLDEMTRPALGRAQVVIADRFLYSAEILARFGRGLPESFVRPVLDAAARGLQPDLVVLVDIDPHVARARRQVAKVLTADKRPPSRKGLSGVGIQHRFRAGYKELAAREPQRWVVVDNDQDLDATVERVFALLHDAAKNGAPAAVERHGTQPGARRVPAKPISTPAEALELFLQWIDDRAKREPNVAAYFLAGMFGEGVDERRRALADRAPDSMLAGVSGLDDAVSWELREGLRDKAPTRAARSLSGFPGGHPRARKLRAELAERVPIDVLASFDGIDDEEAWALRDRLYATAPDVVVASVMRVGGPRAQTLRERWLADRGGFDSFAVYETARIASKAVSGLDDERAWEFRKAARESAPIAALASLAYVDGDRAWKWRNRWLERAPKTVFATVRRSDDARAWDMREEMAATCKEAIDSMQDLDGPRAWALRERCADLWTSTVVKTLGPLATTPRGRELIARQLTRYPDNVSLLKHAAAVAVGAHLPKAIAQD